MIILILLVWFLSGMAASYICGIIEGRYMRKYGYDLEEVQRLENDLLEEQCGRVYEIGPVAGFLYSWIAPIIFWPIWLCIVEFRASIKAMDMIDQPKMREES